VLQTRRVERTGEPQSGNSGKKRGAAGRLPFCKSAGSVAVRRNAQPERNKRLARSDKQCARVPCYIDRERDARCGTPTLAATSKCLAGRNKSQKWAQATNKQRVTVSNASKIVACQQAARSAGPLIRTQYVSDPSSAHANAALSWGN
jgi:hypothetical protein